MEPQRSRERGFVDRRFLVMDRSSLDSTVCMCVCLDPDRYSCPRGHGCAPPSHREQEFGSRRKGRVVLSFERYSGIAHIFRKNQAVPEKIFIPNYLESWKWELRSAS
jgi:hypothetical protein